MAATTSFPVRCSGLRARCDVEGTIPSGKKAGGRYSGVQSPSPERAQLLAPERL
jgi:hypothetical protein